MNKEEIRQFKSLLNQGILRHENILLDYKFQSALLEIIKDYEKLEQENKQLKEKIEIIQEKFKDFKKAIVKERKHYLCKRDCAFRLKENKQYHSFTKQIENLEQENKQLKEEIKELKDSSPLDEAFYNGTLKLEREYKERIKKAIEYINNACYSPEFNKSYLDNLLEILKGDSND